MKTKVRVVDPRDRSLAQIAQGAREIEEARQAERQAKAAETMQKEAEMRAQEASNAQEREKEYLRSVQGRKCKECLLWDKGYCSLSTCDGLPPHMQDGETLVVKANGGLCRYFKPRK